MPTSEDRINEVGRRAQENANLIWNAANSLFGAFKPHEYGLVILPMCVIKRFHDCLLPKHEAILEAYELYKDFGELKDGFLKEAAGYQFYNTSKFTFSSLLSDPENIEENFRDFLAGFSQNVQEILSRMGFHQQIDRMVEAKCLYQVIVDFSAENLNMGPERISTVDMGYIFENLVQRFSESYNEEAGAHFTSRDIIYLMCDLLLTNGGMEDKGDGIHCTVYDMTMGTSQMLTCMEERLHALDENADVQTFGQEINPFTMGIAVADTMIHGGDPDNMRFGDTLSDDQFKGYQFDYVISNPPFGIDWKREAEAVEAENKLGPAGRFEPGLPPKSDGQMLFMLNGIAKLKPGSGKMAIIQNSSSMETGDAGSGQSEIRRYIIERDWLDAIIQLPSDSFYNTPIPTYIWIIDKSKPTRTPGKILLIDASKCSVSRRKNIGNKKIDIDDDCRDLIVTVYGEYNGGNYSKTLDSGKVISVTAKLVSSSSLGYKKIIIERPLIENGKPILKKGKPIADTSKRDTEKVSLEEDIDIYFENQIKPVNPCGWIDLSKIKTGYEISFTKLFYEYSPLEPSHIIADRIRIQEESTISKLDNLLPGIITNDSDKREERLHELVDSGYDWIGKIPKNWRIVKAKQILQNITEKGHPDAVVLSLYRDYGVVPKDSRDDNHNVTSLDTASYKYVRIGNLVINKMKAWQGSLAVSKYEGIVSPAYYVCAFIDENVNKEYIHHLLRTKQYAQEFERLSSGMRTGQWDLGIDDFLRIPIVLPPVEEQSCIVEYLDRRIKDIDILINEQEKLIQELYAYRKSLIAEVTTGKRGEK